MNYDDEEDCEEALDTFNEIDTNDDYHVTKDEFLAYTGDSELARDAFTQLDKQWLYG